MQFKEKRFFCGLCGTQVKLEDGLKVKVEFHEIAIKGKQNYKLLRYESAFRTLPGLTCSVKVL